MAMTMRMEEDTYPKSTAGWSLSLFDIETLPTLALSSFLSHKLNVVTSSSGS